MAVTSPDSVARAAPSSLVATQPWYYPIVRFARRKPLGAVCGLVVITLLIVGDLVPEVLNKVSRTAGMGQPVPYVADVLRDSLPFVYAYDKGVLSERLQGPSSKHLLGTDSSGRDVFSRLLYGARVAVVVSFGALLISETIGATLGIMSGFYGGLVDKFGFRIVDMFQSLPALVLLITILSIYGSGLWQLVLVLGLVSGPAGSRVVRGQTLSIMSSPYVESARVIGASDRRIMLKYILPNVFHLIILQSTLRLGAFVLIEASLSFLGFGMKPPLPSWGQMLSLDGRNWMRFEPGLAVFPGLAIGLLVFSYNLFGDALRDVLDPRLRGTR